MNEGKGPADEMSKSFEVIPHSCFVRSFGADEDLTILACCLLAASALLKHSPSLTIRPQAIMFPSVSPTWTWLKPDDYHIKQRSLSCNWSLRDQIAGFVCNKNGCQMPLTSPYVRRGLWWQPVGITSKPGNFPIYKGHYWAIFRIAKPHNKAVVADQRGWQNNHKEPDV